MSCTQTTLALTQTEAEARFALLLKPVQELTKEQWAVNLSNNLGEYLHFLRDFCVTTEGNYKMNFAQAAMIIQNSTQLYGKRIDHLWSLMKEMLDTLHNQKKASSEESEGAEENGASQRLSRQMCWDSTNLIENVEVPLLKKKAEETTETTSSAKVKFINLVPKDVLKLEDAVASANPLKVKVFNRFGDLLCYSTDLRTNLPLNSNDCLLGMMNIGSSTSNVFTFVEPQQGNDDHMPVENNYDDSFTGCDDAGAPDEDVPLPTGAQCDPNLVTEAGIERHQPVLSSAPVIPPRISADPRDALVTLDPYEEVGQKKEIKPGKPYKVPTQLAKNARDNGDGCRSAVSPVDYEVFKEMLRKITKSNYRGRKLVDEFRDESVRQQRNRLALKRAVRSSRNAPLEENGDSESESECSEGNRLPSPTPAGDDDVVNDYGDSDNVFQNYEHAQSDAVRENPFDLLERRMQEYMETAQEMAQSSEMTKRVAQWHDTIKPRLVRAENRRDFDIHEYGSKVLESFGKDAPIGSQISYNVCLQGQEKEEVARLFLATLQLTNAGNIDIIKLNDHELAIHEVELRLKSRDRHHEQIEEFSV